MKLALTDTIVQKLSLDNAPVQGEKGVEWRKTDKPNYLVYDSNRLAPPGFAVRVASAGFEAFGIHSGDFVVVDRSAKAEKDSICLCWTEESIALQRGGDDLQPWGVVVALARKL